MFSAMSHRRDRHFVKPTELDADYFNKLLLEAMNGSQNDYFSIARVQEKESWAKLQFIAVLPKQSLHVLGSGTIIDQNFAVMFSTDSLKWVRDFPLHECNPPQVLKTREEVENAIQQIQQIEQDKRNNSVWRNTGLIKSVANFFTGKDAGKNDSAAPSSPKKPSDNSRFKP